MFAFHSIILLGKTHTHSRKPSNSNKPTKYTYTNTHTQSWNLYKRGKSKGKIIVLYRPNIEYIIVLIYLE